MNDFETALTGLAAEHRSAAAPDSVETAVLNAFDARRRRILGMRISAAGAIAGALAIGAFVAVPRGQQPRLRIMPLPQVAVAPTVERHELLVRKHVAKKQLAVREAPFVAIPYTVPFAPGEEATIVRMTLSPAALAAVGVPLPEIDPGREAQADVLVGFDGRARAIRLVASSGVNQ